MSAAASYVEVPCEEKETFTDVAARHGLGFGKGWGYYALVKPEEVSEAKEMILVKASGERVIGGPKVRQELGLKVGKIKVAPGQVPQGCTLYIQSTSPNRQLPAGKALIYIPAGSPIPPGLVVGASGAAPAAGAAAFARGTAKRARRSRRGGGDDDDDDEDDDGGNDGGDGEDDGDDDDNALLHWERLAPEDVLNDEGGMDEFEAEDLVRVDEEGFWNDCDMAVPHEKLLPVVDSMVKTMIACQGKWSAAAEPVLPATEKEKADPRFEPKSMLEWTAPGGVKMRVYRGEEVMYALENPKLGLAVISGSAGAHPFIYSTKFHYSNSDGSSSDRQLPGKPTAEVTLSTFISHVWYHGHVQDG